MGETSKISIELLGRQIVATEYPKNASGKRWIARMSGEPDKYEGWGATSNDASLRLIQQWSAGKGIVNTPDPLAKLIEMAEELGTSHGSCEKGMVPRVAGNIPVDGCGRTRIDVLLNLTETFLGLEARKEVSLAFRQACATAHDE